jgi:hypothetical protein
MNFHIVYCPLYILIIQVSHDSSHLCDSGRMRSSDHLHDSDRMLNSDQCHDSGRIS